MKDFFKYTFIGLGAVAIIGIGISVVNIITAPSRAVSGVVSQTLNSSNIINTYERFHDLWKSYDARLAQIRETKSYLEAETNQAEKTRLRVDLSAQRASCRDAAQRYNADAAKTNRVIFQGREAPSTLDMSACDR